MLTDEVLRGVKTDEQPRLSQCQRLYIRVRSSGLREVGFEVEVLGVIDLDLADKIDQASTVSLAQAGWDLAKTDEANFRPCLPPDDARP